MKNENRTPKSDIEKAIQRGATYIMRAVNASNEEAENRNYYRAEAFCEGAALALGFPEDVFWGHMKREAKQMMLDAVEDGDSRAANRWNSFWN